MKETNPLASQAQAISKLSTRLLCFIALDIFLSLFYFWFAQLSYGLRIKSSSMFLPLALRYGEVHWQGPGPLLFLSLGMLSPCLFLLVLLPLWPVLRKRAWWIQGCFCLLWLGEIAALGFFVPQLSWR